MEFRYWDSETVILAVKLNKGDTLEANGLLKNSGYLQ